jgi:hypothetical protein
MANREKGTYAGEPALQDAYMTFAQYSFFSTDPNWVGRGCRECEYWFDDTMPRFGLHGLSIIQTGECHRYPPTFFTAAESGFPETDFHNWCGEYEERKERNGKP